MRASGAHVRGSRVSSEVHVRGSRALGVDLLVEWLTFWLVVRASRVFGVDLAAGVGSDFALMCVVGVCWGPGGLRFWFVVRASRVLGSA